MLFRGQLMEIGDVEEIFAPPFHPYTYELLKAVPSIERQFSPGRTSASRPALVSRAGCAFAGRCAWQVGRICEVEAPPWRDVTPRHRIRCHLSLAELTAHAKNDLAHLGPKTQKLPT